jgi:hypothetical protein
MSRSLSRWVGPEHDRSPRQTTARSRPALEVLEDRTAPAVFSPVPPAVPATAPLSADPTTAYVQILYLDVLGRNATAAETPYWVNVVKAYGPSQAVSGILNSPESQTRMVDNLYMQLLARQPDAGGLLHWKGVLAADGLEAVTAGIVSSNEFRSNHPGNAVTVEYQALLSRAPDAAELAQWTPVLSAQGPDAVARGIEATTEFRSNVTQFLFVQDINIPATAAQLASFANTSALSLLQIEATVLDSPAFLENVGL